MVHLGCGVAGLMGGRLDVVRWLAWRQALTAVIADHPEAEIAIDLGAFCHRFGGDFESIS